jgi:hypothetical protein
MSFEQNWWYAKKELSHFAKHEIRHNRQKTFWMFLGEMENKPGFKPFAADNCFPEPEFGGSTMFHSPSNTSIPKPRRLQSLLSEVDASRHLEEVFLEPQLHHL